MTSDEMRMKIYMMMEMERKMMSVKQEPVMNLVCISLTALLMVMKRQILCLALRPHFMC